MSISCFSLQGFSIEILRIYTVLFSKIFPTGFFWSFTQYICIYIVSLYFTGSLKIIHGGQLLKGECYDI
jgi:hypothetical protein